jgi:hypothetical protein
LLSALSKLHKAEPEQATISSKAFATSPRFRTSRANSVFLFRSVGSVEPIWAEACTKTPTIRYPQHTTLAIALPGSLHLRANRRDIGAAVRQQWIPIGNVQPARDSFWLAFESIDSPGNLGTIIRTAEATGVAGIFCCGFMPIHGIPPRFVRPWDHCFRRSWCDVRLGNSPIGQSHSESRSSAPHRPACWTIRRCAADGRRCS